MSDTNGVLYIVATPIGNLADISQRALDVLQSVDLIAAEDTRHSQKLLSHYGINQRMMALHEHNERERANEIVTMVQNGSKIALISDAGTPLISDPGYHLTCQAHEAGIKIVSIPGPSALTAALSVSGLPTDRFVFEGFLSSKTTTRDKQLIAMKAETRTMVFYEAPHRLLETIEAMCRNFGEERRITLVREITKTYETIKQKTCEEMQNWIKQNPEQQKGECVLVVEGAGKPDQNPVRVEVDVDDLLGSLLSVMSLKDSAQTVAELTGLGKNDLYQRALILKKK